MRSIQYKKIEKPSLKSDETLLSVLIYSVLVIIMIKFMTGSKKKTRNTKRIEQTRIRNKKN